MIKSFTRGHKIIFVDNQWIYKEEITYSSLDTRIPPERIWDTHGKCLMKTQKESLTDWEIENL